MAKGELKENLISEEIKAVVSETIQELHAQNVNLKFKKPETIQGWLILSFSIATLIGFFYSTIVVIHDVRQHHTEPMHNEAAKILDKLNTSIKDHHNNDNFHRKEEALQLKILQETKPLTNTVQSIKEDVKAIETKVDILIDREFKKNNN